MPLRLLIGPANSGKAGRLMADYRARLDRDPLLAVPAFGDVERTQRELSRAGAVFGPRVVRFEWLFELIAERADPGLLATPRASEVTRALIVEQAVRSTALAALSAPAAGPGFRGAALRFFAELEGARVDPGRLRAALRRWAGEDGPRSRHAQELAALYGFYRERLSGAGLLDPELFAWRALDALRREPFRWGGSPVFVHGFDDFTHVELDAIETLARRVGVEITVSLPYERGRQAFRSVATVFEHLASLADEVTELPARSEHYAAGAGQLHHLERALFEDGNGAAAVEAGGAVRLLSAGGARAEVELVAAEVIALLRGGTAPGEVAVVFRDPARYATLVEQVFGAYGIPVSLERPMKLQHAALGRGLLALLRCALLDGTADDLVTYLRTPGRLTRAAAADRLESEVRRTGSATARQATDLWESMGRYPLGEIGRLRRAGSGAALVAELDDQLTSLWRPHAYRPCTVEAAELEDAGVVAAARAALADLHALAQAGLDSDLGPRRLHDTLAELPVRTGLDPGPERVLVTSPEGTRARRFQALFVCGLQEGEFPRAPRPEPFVPDEDRRELALRGGIALPAREDELERERFLFYLCASRPERLLVLSSRASDEQGAPEQASFFVEDVKDVFAPTLAAGARTRSLSEVVWPDDAPSAVEWERARAAGRPIRATPPPAPLSHPEVVAWLRERTAFSAGALEAYADCPVKWLIDRVLDPVRLEPDPEHLVRGSFAHEVLEATYVRLRERTGDRRVRPENLAQAERLVVEALAERHAGFPLSPRQTRVRAAVRRLEFDLLRYLRREAATDGSFEPAHLELEFGLDGDEDALPALRLGEEGIAIRGRIDRIDTSGRRALVIDYKSGRKTFPVATWERENRLQAPIYMLAVRELLGLEPVGGVYAPLAGRDLRPRGLLAAEAGDELGSGYVDNDLLEAPRFGEQLERAERRVGDLIGAVREGQIACRPDTCAWNGGCSYPAICRQEG